MPREVRLSPDSETSMVHKTKSTLSDETDLRIVAKIVEAAIWYTMEEKVDLEVSA